MTEVNPNELAHRIMQTIAESGADDVSAGTALEICRALVFYEDKRQRREIDDAYRAEVNASKRLRGAAIISNERKVN